MLSFWEALWAEYRSRGVRVLALAAGPTETVFWDSWEADQPRGTDAFVGTTSADDVVAAGLEVLEAGKGHVVPGRRNRLMARSPRLMPRSLITLFGERLLRPRREGAAADEGVQMRDIAEVIGRHLDVPTVAISPEEADDHFGWLSFVVSVDNPTLSALTRERMGWNPAHPALIPDLDQGHYFDT